MSIGIKINILTSRFVNSLSFAVTKFLGFLKIVYKFGKKYYCNLLLFNFISFNISPGVFNILLLKLFLFIVDVSNIAKPPGIPGFIGNTKLPAIKCSVHEQDDGTIVSVCATGDILARFFLYYTIQKCIKLIQSYLFKN